MFQCHLCASSVPAGTPAQRLILEIRARHYPPRDKIYPKAAAISNGKTLRREWKSDPGGEGSEIVREVLVCPKCAARQKSPALSKL